MALYDAMKIKAEADIKQFAKDHLERVNITNDEWLTARCPGHNDDTNSLSIYYNGEKAGWWTCFAGCRKGEKKDLVNIINMIQGNQYIDGLAYLEQYNAGNSTEARPIRIPGDSFAIESEPFKLDKSWFNQCENRICDNNIFWQTFLKDKLISENMVAAMRLGIDQFHNLVLPAIDAVTGEILGMRFRSMDHSKWWARGSKPSQTLYGNIELINPSIRTAYITEGETDTLSLLSLDTESLAANRSLSVFGLFGAAMHWQESWSKKLKEIGIKEIVICGDNDRAGRLMNESVSDELMKHGFLENQIKVIDWSKMGKVLKIEEIPEKYDINEAIKAGLTKESLPECVKPLPTVARIVAVDKDLTSRQLPQNPADDIELPDSAWPPQLAEMRDALHVRLPTPDPMIMGSLLALLSHIVGRRACTTVFGRHVPAMYCMNVGDTNIGKSAILDYMSQDLIPQLTTALRLSAGSSGITTYGCFASDVGAGKAFSEVADTRILQMVDEYSLQLMKAKLEGGGPIIQSILSLWQGSSQGSISKSGGWDLTGRHLSIASATTKIYLHTHMRREDVMGGYANRFTYWLGFKHQARKVYTTPDPDPRVVEDFCNAVQIMSSNIGAHSAGKPKPDYLINPTREAKDLAIQWIQEFEKELANMEEIQTLVTNRIPSHIARIATLFALLDHQTEITATQMRRAIEVGEYLKKTVWSVFGDYGMSGPTAAASFIINKIEANGGRLGKRQLHQSIPSRYREHLSKAISDMQRQGILLESVDGKKRFWTLAQLEGEEVISKPQEHDDKV